MSFSKRSRKNPTEYVQAFFRSLRGKTICTFKDPNRRFRLSVEELEDRRVLAYMFVDFGDMFPSGTLSTTQGAFRDVANDAVPGNRVLGTQLVDNVNAFSATTPLDIVKQTFSATNRSEMMAVIRRAYVPVNVTIVELSSTAQTTADGRTVLGATSMADVVNTLRGGTAASKDAYIFVATFNIGGANPKTYGPGGGGNSPVTSLDTSDLSSATNSHDDVAAVFSAGGFNFNTMNNISHEAGHCFGLRHSITNATNDAAIDLFHQAEIMSYRNTNNTTSSIAFTRYPMIQGDSNSPGGPVLNYNSLAARTGDSTLYDQLRTDANVGANPNYTFVSGTGAHDIITITKVGLNANVSVQAFGDAAYSAPITVPGIGGTTYSYTIPLTQTILIYGGGSNDRFIIDGNLGVNVEIDGMLGTDTLRVNGMGAANATYTPNTTAPIGVDRNTSLGGQLLIGSNTITFVDFESTGRIEVDNVTTVNFAGGSGADTITSDLSGGATRLTGSIGVTTFVPVFSTNFSGLQINTLSGNDTLTLNLDTGDFIPTSGIAFSGGDPTNGTGDRLSILGGIQGTVTYNYVDANSGSVAMTSFGTLTYTGLESISNAGTASDIVFNLPGNPNNIVLGDDGILTNNLSRLTSSPLTVDSTTFRNPTNSLTINRGNSSDVATVASLPDFSAAMTIGATGSEFSNVAFSGVVSIASIVGFANVIDFQSSSSLSTASGGISLVADALSINSSSTLNAGTNVVSVRPKTNGTLIELGGADGIGTLGLTDLELDRITAGTIKIGDVNSGAITTTANITRPNSTNLELKSGGSIVLNPGSINSISGTVLMDAGSGGFQPISSGTDIVSSSLSFASGDQVSIQINGANVDTQYRQLNVLGAVNLTGANLLLSTNFPTILGTEIFTIVASTSGITGTFSNFAEGTQLSIGSLIYKIRYNSNNVQLVLAPSTLQEAYLFYKGSAYQSALGVAGAIDPVNDGANPQGKDLLQSGSLTLSTSIVNVSNYSKGINGLVFDVNNLIATTLNPSDFVFRQPTTVVSGIVDPSTWLGIVPTPTMIDVSIGTPSRVRIEWADNAIENTWLQIILKANTNTGLAAPVVYYIGHAAGEMNGTSPYRVGTPEISAVQSGISSALVSLSDVRDVDKSRRVGVSDLSFIQARNSATILLQNITIPIAGSAAEGAPAPSLDAVLQSAPDIGIDNGDFARSVRREVRAITSDTSTRIALQTVGAANLEITTLFTDQRESLPNTIEFESSIDQFFAAFGKRKSGR